MGSYIQNFQLRENSAAHKLLECTDPFVLIVGPRNCGKTMAVLHKLLNCLLQYPNSRALLVRQRRKDLTSSALITWENEVLPPELLKQITRVGGKKAHRQSYDFPNGSILQLGDLEKSTKILSAQYDMVVICQSEEVSEESFNSILGSMRNNVMPYQQIILDANPTFTYHWNNTKEGITRLRATHQDNPVLYDLRTGKRTPFGDHYIGTILEALTGAARERFLHGRYANAEGIVYEEFDPNRHVLKEAPVKKFNKYYGAIDWGWNVSVVQLWGQDQMDNLYLVKESYRTKQTTAMIAAECTKMMEHYDVEVFVADSAEPGSIEELNSRGIPIVGAEKPQGSVIHGINLVKQRLVEDRIFFVNGFQHEDPEIRAKALPTNLLQELDSFIWAKDKDKPIEMNDHAVTAMRYLVSYLDDRAPMYIDFIDF